MPTTPEILEIERHFKADPERLFDAFASYEGMKAWFGPGECHVIDGELEFEVGGRYRLRVQTEESGEVEVVGVYQTVERPHRISFTWRWQGNPTFQAADSVVDITFDPQGNGTLLRLVQTGIQEDEARANHGHGWNGAFDKLEAIFSST